MPLPDRELLARLVGFDSTSAGSNIPIADFVCEYLERPGVTIRRLPGADGTQVNVVAVAGGPDPPDGSGLTLCGHLDVVPAGESGWKSDPFTLTDAGDTWVARGACDMKGSIALGMNIMAGLDPDRLRRPLALLLTWGEEIGSVGARELAASGGAAALPAAVVVGEPTSLRAVRMHKGHLTMRVTVQGRAAHSGSPHLGRNAVESGARVVTALSRLADLFKTKRCDASHFFPAVPFAVLNVGMIRGGCAVNVVPDRCVIDLGIRLLPGMNPQASIEWVRDAVVKSVPGQPLEVEVLVNNPPMLLDERAAIHQALCAELGQRQSVGVSFASDAGELSQAGMECVLFGPGSIEVAHRPNEFLPVEEFNRARTVLDHLVTRFCMS